MLQNTVTPGNTDKHDCTCCSWAPRWLRRTSRASRRAVGGGSRSGRRSSCLVSNRPPIARRLIAASRTRTTGRHHPGQRRARCLGDGSRQSGARGVPVRSGSWTVRRSARPRPRHRGRAVPHPPAGLVATPPRLAPHASLPARLATRLAPHAPPHPTTPGPLPSPPHVGCGWCLAVV